MKKILSALIIVTVVFTALSLLYVSANEGTATVITTGNVAAGNPGAGDAAVVGAENLHNSVIIHTKKDCLTGGS